MTSDDDTPVRAIPKGEAPNLFNKAMAEVFGASDRAGAIVSSAQVEDALASAIKGRLRELSQADLGVVFSGQAAPLNSFHAKIQMGFALGLYGQPVREDLQVVKDVRNRFAHHIEASTFADEAITSLCAKLHYPYHRVNFEERVFTEDELEEEETNPKRRFQGTTAQLYFGLALIGGNPARPQPPLKWIQMLTYERRPDAPVPSQKKVRVRPSKRKTH